MSWTAIRVDSEVKEALAKRGTMMDSFNDVLRRMLDLPDKGTDTNANNEQPRTRQRGVLAKK